MWTLIGTYNYILYSDDIKFLKRNWNKYTKAVDFILQKLTNQGLMNVSGKRDWARWNQGGENGEANILLYHTLITASKLSTWQRNQNRSVTSFYTNKAKSLKRSINTQLYDKIAKAYKDSTSHPDLHPQDANALAILFDATPSISQKLDVSRSLLNNWRLYGPEPPELPGNVSPFISSLELHAHFSIGETMRALDLLRRTWGWYLTHANGTQSTMIEGFRVDGTFGYRAERGYNRDASYVSHAHGWSTGPTSALTNYIAGLDVLDRAGLRWSFKPQFGGLDFAEAGFATKLGLFRTKWSMNKSPSVGYDVTIETPNRTVGEIGLPALKGSAMMVLVNNKIMDVQEDGVGMHFELPGGTYNITVRSADPSQATGVSPSWWPWS
jgi:Bacterial alpha-L-rhamnosidase 6 hairpin glycosidase domain